MRPRGCRAQAHAVGLHRAVADAAREQAHGVGTRWQHRSWRHGEPWHGAGVADRAATVAEGRRHLIDSRSVARELNHVRQRWEVAQLEVLIARNVVGRADGGKHLRLLDGVNPEVGFEIEVQVQHVLRIAGLFGDNLQHLVRGSRAMWHPRRWRRCGCRGVGLPSRLG